MPSFLCVPRKYISSCISHLCFFLISENVLSKHGLKKDRRDAAYLLDSNCKRAAKTVKFVSIRFNITVNSFNESLTSFSILAIKSFVVPLNRYTAPIQISLDRIMKNLPSTTVKTRQPGSSAVFVCVLARLGKIQFYLGS